MIHAQEISKIYASGAIQVKALDKVSFHVEKGEYVSIMGASGSGKTTLLHILGCLDNENSGLYVLDGVNVSELKDKDFATIRNLKIGFVFQSFNLLPKLSALENVELPMLYGGVKAKERRERANQALERVGLGDRVRHKPNELSGGQKQRVAIARALVNNPAIILADEPTGNLDSTSSVEIMQIFKELNDEGSTIVMVTHEDEIAAYTKRKIVFKDGKIIKDEPVS